MVFAHRFVCQEVHGAPPSDRHHAAHSCGKGHEGCINPRHLRWATPLENAHDAIVAGTYPHGETVGTAKLTECDIRNIRAEYAKGGLTQTALARFYDVSGVQIGRIINHVAWAHV
jgi:hypothetical protein